MGLFDKKYCDICGEKIGLLGNRKLEDGNLCKDCAKKLSPFFSERRSSTVEEIRQQLAYREENQRQLSGFRPSITFGENKKVYIDPSAGTFIVTSYSNWSKANPDLIRLSQVRAVNTDIREHKEEQYYEDEEGKKQSYTPPRYECDYEFHVTIHVDSPWFEEIGLELSYGHRPDSPYTDLYRRYEQQMFELKQALTGQSRGQFMNQQGQYSNVPQGQFANQQMQANPQQSGAWICPSCQQTNDGGKFCQSCGATRPLGMMAPAHCRRCGWAPSMGENMPRFCPECGEQL